MLTLVIGAVALNLHVSTPKRVRDPVAGAMLRWEAHSDAESFLLSGVNVIEPWAICPMMTVDADLVCTVPDATGTRACEYPPQSVDCLTTVQAWAGAASGPGMTEQDVRCDPGAGTGCPCDVLPSPAGCVQ